MPFLRDILRVPFTYVRDPNVHTPHLDKQARGLFRNHEGGVGDQSDSRQGMTTATLTSTCQVTLPKAIRDLLGVGPGDEVVFWANETGRVVVEPQTVDLRTLRGSLRPGKTGVTLQAMDDAVRQPSRRT